MRLPRFRVDTNYEGEIKDKEGRLLTTSYYSGLRILRLTFILIIVVACLLPTVAIIVLAQINSKGLVLKLITVFTAVFSLGLILFSSSSSRQQIFVATIG
jgi:hypothetical protein